MAALIQCLVRARRLSFLAVILCFLCAPLAQGRALSARLESEASLSGNPVNTGDLAFLGESRNGLLCHDNSVNGIDLTGHEFTLAQSITTLTTAEGLQGMKGGVETKVEWEIRDMAKQLANDYSPSDLNQKLGLEGEEVWTRYLNAIPGFSPLVSPVLAFGEISEEKS